MSSNSVFKRYEMKYMLTVEQYEKLKEFMAGYMKLDGFGHHLISNIYFDTKDFLLIRRSLEKPAYKEKLRVRHYGEFTEDSKVFVEMKKKYNGVVYKRRLALSEHDAFEFLNHEAQLKEKSQIGKELEYFVNHYKGLAPAMALSYEREAYYCETDSEFRMTFDQNIKASAENISFSASDSMIHLLDDNKVLLEVKTTMGLPTWLLSFFGENHIYKTSFSKYGTAYKEHVLPKITGGRTYVA